MENIRYELTGDLNLTDNPIDFGTTIYQSNGLKINQRFGALFKRDVDADLLYDGNYGYFTFKRSENNFNILKDNALIGNISNQGFLSTEIENIPVATQTTTIYASLLGGKETLLLTDEAGEAIATISLSEEINSFDVAILDTSNIRLTAFTSLDYYTYDINIFNKTISDRLYSTGVIGGSVIEFPQQLGSTHVANCYSLTSDTITNGLNLKTIYHTLKCWYNGSVQAMDTVSRKIPISSTSTKPTGGLSIPTRSSFYINQFNYTEQNIAFNNNIVEANLDHVVYIDTNTVYYYDNLGTLKALTTQILEKPLIVGILNDRYICFNTSSKNNTVDLKTSRFFSRSKDYNARLWVDNNLVSDGTSFVEQYIASGINEQWYTKGFTGSGCNYPSISIVYNTTDQLNFQYYPKLNNTPVIQDDYDNYINIYVTANSTGAVTQYPSYYRSIRRGSFSLNYALQDFNWPTDTTLTLPVINTISSTVLNKGVTYNGVNSSTLQNDINNLVTFNYVASDYLNSKTIFLLNGDLYGYDDKFIYNLQYSGGTVQSETPVFNMDGYTFLGVLNSSVLLYAKMDKSLYRFTGSMVVEKIKDASGIDADSVGSYKQMLGGNALVFSTDYGTILFYDGQFTRIGDSTDNLESSSNICIGDKVYALYEEPGYSKDKLTLETEFIPTTGSLLKGNVIGVVLRLDNHSTSKKTGQVKLTISTLTDIVKQGTTQTIDVLPNVWDIRNQAMIRFTPRFNSCNAIKLKIESDFDILDMILETDATESKVVTKNK